ncbi:MAG: hypothetical protein KDB24_12700 [Microthrixaceae bacterium]|nr:hypothetical protein [Microthrixaceae bacterium]
MTRDPKTPTDRRATTVHHARHTDGHDERPTIRAAVEALVGAPAIDDNAVEVLRNGDEIFPAMLDAIESAEETIDFLTFIYWSGDIGRRFAEALGQASERGVAVRVLLDSLGARRISDELVESMQDRGARVEWFRPVEGQELGKAHHRTHRKILVVDDVIGFIGGVGIADEWTGDARDETEWRDTHFRVEGPAVSGLRAAFVSNWAETGQEVLRDGERFPELAPAGDVCCQVVHGAAEAGWSDISTLFRVLIGLAQERLRICTAYFTPDEILLGQLVEASQRGVAVEVLVPGPHADKRFVQLGAERCYETLLEAGVVVRSFQPAMLHAKIMTVDGLVATVGSANFNTRSAALDDEANLVIYDERIVSILDRHYDEDVERSEEIDLERWKDRGWIQRVKEKVLGPAEPFM